MGSIYEIVERGIFSFFRMSFMIAGHTKFCPDRLFGLLAKSFHSYEVFNEEQFLCVYGQHANITSTQQGKVEHVQDLRAIENVACNRNEARNEFRRAYFGTTRLIQKLKVFMNASSASIIISF